VALTKVGKEGVTGISNSSNATAITIDSSENVGIGVTDPSTWSLGKALHIGNKENNLWGEADYAFHMSQNAYYNGGWKYSHTDEATRYSQEDGKHIWSYAGSGSANAALTWLEAMRIDTSGIVGIGTASGTQPSYFNSFLNVQNNASTSDHASVTITSGSGGYAGLHFGDSDNGRIGQVAYNNADNALTFTANNSERMRIDSAGNLLIGRTVATSNTGGHFITPSYGFFENDGTPFFINRYNSNGDLLIFRKNNSGVGSISTNGSSTAYNTSSDYRLKTAVNYDWDATTRLKQLKPARFEWIADGDDAVPVDGFLAHEAQTVVPEAVTGIHNEVEVWKDGEELPDGVSVGDNKLDADGNTIPVMQGIDQSKLVPLLVKTIQELEARITALEAK